MVSTDAPTVSNSRIVVGVSASPAGRAALVVAAREAAAHHVTLHLVRVWQDVGWMPSMGEADTPKMAGSEHVDQELIDAALRTVRSLRPDLVVTSEFIEGDVYAILADLGKTANTLVLGAAVAGEESSLGIDWFCRNVTCPIAFVDQDGTLSRVPAASTPGDTVDRGEREATR